MRNEAAITLQAGTPDVIKIEERLKPNVKDGWILKGEGYQIIYSI